MHSQLAAASIALLTMLASPARVVAQDDLRALDGEWIYVEDRTADRELDRLGPPMSSKFSLRVETGAVILVSGHGSGHRDVRVALDGSIHEIAEGEKSVRYRGAVKDGAFRYQVDFVRAAGAAPAGLIEREFRVTSEGLIVRAGSGGSAASDSIALYRHAQDIPLATPAPAVIADLSWIAGAWGGTRGASGTTSIEERWSPPLGGAMLGTSRTVSRGRMSAFEFLRIVERDGGLVYIAQPGGAAATEFILSEWSATRAVFDNPRHDYPKRITYELSSEGKLSATIGFMKGGTPRRFEFQPLQ